VLIDTDGSQQNLMWFLAETFEMRNVSSQKYASKKTKYTKAVAFLSQQFGLNCCLIEIKLTFLANCCKVTDMMVQQDPAIEGEIKTEITFSYK